MFTAWRRNHRWSKQLLQNPFGSRKSHRPVSRKKKSWKGYKTYPSQLSISGRQRHARIRTSRDSVGTVRYGNRISIERSKIGMSQSGQSGRVSSASLNPLFISLRLRRLVRQPPRQEDPVHLHRKGGYPTKKLMPFIWIGRAVISSVPL